MKPTRADFVRNLGTLRIHVQYLNRGLRENDVDVMERESKVIQEVLLDLIKNQRKLPREQQQAVRPHFTAIRKDALRCLELARKIMDDSLQAMLGLIKACEEAGNYGPGGGSSIMVDRQA
ncbi:hypothetical protein HZB60_00985 [candidate division KSB1 bacterium]|nr:hypothetical protein [candidate division KSB1 bacterium]